MSTNYLRFSNIFIYISRFELGNETDMNRYLKQFIDIFTDMGSNPMKIVTENCKRNGKLKEKSVAYTWGAYDYLKQNGLEMETQVCSLKIAKKVRS